VVVANHAPETMLGDEAVAVNSDRCTLPKARARSCCYPENKQIPIIADDTVDPKFGTAA